MADAAYSLGVLYEGRGDKANAVLAFQQAVKAKPDHSEALEALKRLGVRK
jgi:TolA-binding protein